MAPPISDDDLTRLAGAAREASRRAYCPYSGFAVGAAVLTEAGDVVTGGNVENASYGLTLCAERSAIVGAVARGATSIRAVAVYTPTATPTPPCGACRQAINEFGPDAVVLCVCDGPAALLTSLPALLPDAFGPGNLRPGVPR